MSNKFRHFIKLSQRKNFQTNFNFIKYNEVKLIEKCENWLEMNLVTQLSSTSYLKQIPIELLIKTIKSNR